jgi:hypothetical protein
LPLFPLTPNTWQGRRARFPTRYKARMLLFVVFSILAHNTTSSHSASSYRCSHWSSSDAASAMKGIDDTFLSVRETSCVRSPLFLSSASSFLFTRTIVFQNRIQIGVAFEHAYDQNNGYKLLVSRSRKVTICFSSWLIGFPFFVKRYACV